MRWRGVSRYWGEERCIRDSGGEMCGKDLGVNGRIMLKWIFMKWGGEHGMD